MFQSRMAILLGSYQLRRFWMAMARLFQSRMAILLGSYVKIVMANIFNFIVSIANGDSFGELQSVCRSQWQHEPVSIANGDSFGELPINPAASITAFVVSIANGDSFGELLAAQPAPACAYCRFNREWRFFWGATWRKPSRTSVEPQFQSRMAILLGSYPISSILALCKAGFQSRMAILLGSYQQIPA
ncbi:MAG: hypothetical protein H6656_19075 [Ardenticatenaceae bacterium]|nr:hypothetical protein [Ardenticatenaceae bacterium]